LISIVRRYVKQVMDDDVAGISAELAYRFMFATFPFAIFIVALSGFIASWLGIEDPGSRIIGAISKDLPANLVGPVQTQIQAALVHTQPGLLSVGALVTFYAAAAGTSSLMKAMNRAYDVRETRPLVLRMIYAAILTVVAGVAIVVSFVAIVGGTLVTHRVVDQVGLHDVWPWLALLRWPGSFALLVVAVAALIRFAPDFRTPWRWAAVAAVVFAVVPDARRPRARGRRCGRAASCRLRSGPSRPDDAARQRLDDGEFAGVEALAADLHPMADLEIVADVEGRQVDRGDGGPDVAGISRQAGARGCLVAVRATG
jgi:membrane protein